MMTFYLLLFYWERHGGSAPDTESNLSIRSRSTKKVDLLIVFNIFSRLRDKNVATELLRKRRDIMIQSPVYDMILEEGIEKGRNEGLSQKEIHKLKK